MIPGAAPFAPDKPPVPRTRRGTGFRAMRGWGRSRRALRCASRVGFWGNAFSAMRWGWTWHAVRHRLSGDGEGAMHAVRCSSVQGSAREARRRINPPGGRHRERVGQRRRRQASAETTRSSAAHDFAALTLQRTAVIRPGHRSARDTGQARSPSGRSTSAGARRRREAQAPGVLTASPRTEKRTSTCARDGRFVRREGRRSRNRDASCCLTGAAPDNPPAPRTPRPQRRTVMHPPRAGSTPGATAKQSQSPRPVPSLTPFSCPSPDSPLSCPAFFPQGLAETGADSPAQDTPAHPCSSPCCTSSTASATSSAGR